MSETPTPTEEPTVEPPRIEVFKDKKGKSRIRIVGANNEKMLTSQAYKTGNNALIAARRLGELMPGVAIKLVESKKEKKQK